MEKPSWPACERNRTPILTALEKIMDRGPARILEIGSGTGQHADYFTAARSDWFWQCTDQQEYLAGIQLWQQEAQRKNFPAPKELDVRVPALWAPLVQHWDWVYSANALHIMHWTTVETLFARLAPLVRSGSGLLIYGPFNQGGRFSSLSNESFDLSLKERDPQMGIRDLEAVDSLAQKIGLQSAVVYGLPANNLLLEYRPRI